MRHLSVLLAILILALTGCLRVPGLSPTLTITLRGQVQWLEGYQAQAAPSEVANGATVSLIDPATGLTVSTALTKPDGSFSLDIKGFTFQSDRPYLLEALKGLKAGGLPNRAGASGARLRTLVSRASGAWTSLTGPTVQINTSSTALCIVSGFRSLTLPQQQALMGSLPPAKASYAPTAELPTGDFTAVQALVTASLTLDQDPVQVIARNSLNGTWVRMERGPFITNLSALRGLPGSTIILYGSGLDAVAANNLITFNGTPASSMSLVPGGIAVTIPPASKGPLILKVGSLETVVEPNFITIPALTTIQTIAGTTLPPAGTMATAWGLFPNAVAVDKSGNNFYFGDAHTYQLYKVTAAGAISHFAGMGGSGYAGDNGLATSALFKSIASLAVDSTGNVYVADSGSYRVRRIDAVTGIITTVAGDGTQGTSGDGVPATAAKLTSPSSLAFDDTGNLYILDDKRVRKVDASTQNITTVAGNLASVDTSEGILATSAKLEYPRSIAVDKDGTLYIAQPSAGGARYVRKVDASTKTITTTPGLNAPSYLATDATGNLYYFWEGTVKKYPYGGGAVQDIAGTWGQSGFLDGIGTAAKLSYSAAGLACTDAGTLFLADTAFRIRKITTPAKVVTTVAGMGARFAGDGGLATDAQFAFPSGGAYDAAGNLYVADTNNYRVRRIDAVTGNITTVAGNGTYGAAVDGAAAISSPLYSVKDVAIDTAGNLFILEGSAIRRLGTDGKIYHYAGGANTADGVAANTARVNCANGGGLAVDAAGHLYLAEYDGYRVRKIDKDTKIITTVAGNGAAGPTTDGVQATSTTVTLPTDIAFDSAGNMYISGFNYRIRKVTPGGIISTIAGTGSEGSDPDGGLATETKIGYNHGVAADLVGNVYFTNGGTVRKIDANTRLISTIVGSSSQRCFNGDGTPATAKFLYDASRLWFDADYQLLVADTTNQRIRRLF